MTALGIVLLACGAFGLLRGLLVAWIVQRLGPVPARAMDGDRWLWYNLRAPAAVGLAAPVARLLELVGAEE